MDLDQDAMSYAEVPLSRGLVAKISPADAPAVLPFKWSAGPAPYSYAFRNGPDGPVRLHRVITNAEPGTTVDHINGDPLDNRRTNPRVVGHKTNGRNRASVPANSSTGALGVSRSRGKFYASISVNGRTSSLGRHPTLEQAIAARQDAELHHFGELCAAWR